MNGGVIGDYKAFSFFIDFAILFSCISLAFAEPKPDFSAKSAILMVEDTGEILYEQNPR